MYTAHTLDALAVAHERGRGLWAEVDAERLAGISQRRSALAASLRRAADRLDPTPLAARPASQS